MSQMLVSPESARDVRVYEARSGRYLHAADLARMLRDACSEVDPITALVLPNVALLVERLALCESHALPSRKESE